MDDVPSHLIGKFKVGKYIIKFEPFKGSMKPVEVSN